ncbi:MAG: ATP-binding protein [Betaproteobacteria bacterium]
MEQAQLATRVMRSSFNAVLDISLLESGFIEATYTNFDVQRLVEEVVRPLESAAAKRGVRLRVTRRLGRDATVRSDRVLLGRVLTNLVSNSIKYSDPDKGGRAAVIVGIVCLPKYVRVEVLDNGTGIPQTEIQSVFKPFHQLDNPERDREKGLGLGLSIVNAILGLLKEHRIETVSVEGKWTRFSIELPRVEGILAHEPADSTPLLTAAVDLSGVYVLLIENDSLLRKATAALLKANGALCEVAGSVEELTQMLPNLERDPDIVLTDYRLPNGRTAVDVVRAVALRLGDNIPTVVITGEVADIEEHEELRGRKILRKPVSPKNLVEEIDRAFLRH